MLKALNKIKDFISSARDGNKSEKSVSQAEIGNKVQSSVLPAPTLSLFSAESNGEISATPMKDEGNLLSEEEEEEPLPSSEDDEDDISLFPKPILVDNTLSVNSTVIPCSYNDDLHQAGMVSPSFTSSLNGNHNSLLNTISSPGNTKFSSNYPGFTSPLYHNTGGLAANKQNIIHSMYSASENHGNVYTSAKGTPAMVPPQQDTLTSSLMHSSMNNSPVSVNGAQNGMSPAVASSVSTGTEELPSDFNLPPDVSYVCHYCDASFQVRGYLSRHIKKHAIVKEYTCPFYKYSDSVKAYLNKEIETREYSSEEEKIDFIKKSKSIKHLCHSNKGEFWRKDTLMVHLKKKHFKINKNVISASKNNEGPAVDTSKLPGHCISCNQDFKNVEEFCHNHILRGSCPALPHGYDIKTNVEENKNRNNKCVLKLIKFSNNEARFIFTKSAVVDPGVFSNREVIDLIVDMAEKNHNNNLQTLYSPDNQRISPVTSGENSTPIVEKLGDNTIVIHPEGVVPIDANKKRKKRRSKKQIYLSKVELSKTPIEEVSTSNFNSPNLQSYASGLSTSSFETNNYNASNNPMIPNNGLQTLSQASVMSELDQRKQQQIIMQIYQQQQNMLQQQLQYQMQQQQAMANVNTYNRSFNQGAQSVDISHQNVSNDADEDFKALDDECEHNTDTNITGYSNKSSPSSSTTYNVNNIKNVNSEKSSLDQEAAFITYQQQISSYYQPQSSSNFDDEDGELAMDDGF
ncbi:hypothetical protein QEN19_001054 [Hanseniaspora menglaensis]